MATEKLVSAGVFTKENDLSFLPQGISQIGAAIIGPTTKGPANIPVLVESYEDYEKTFGVPDMKSYVPYTVKNYLKNSGAVTVVRVAGTNGYSSSVFDVKIQVSGSAFAEGAKYGDTVYGYGLYSTGIDTSSLVLLAPTSVGTPTSDWTVTCVNTSSLICIFQSSSYGVTASFDSTRADYITNVFGSTPTDKAGSPLYVYTNFPVQQDFYVSEAKFGTGTKTIAVTKTNLVNGLKFSGNDVSYTPMIVSQDTNGSKFDLFQFATFNAGKSDIKISISDIRFPGEIPGTDFGSFSVYVRSLSDTDAKPVILDQFTNVNLDPTSIDYIARRIGDQYQEFAEDSDGNSKLYVHGDFSNKSKYIRIIMNTEDVLPKTVIPYGFDEYKLPAVGMPSIDVIELKTSAYDSASQQFNSKIFFGFDFSVADNSNLVGTPIPTNATALSASNFTFDNCIIEYPVGTNTAISWNSLVVANSGSMTSIPRKYRKFSVAFQGGFDGFDPRITKNMGKDISNTNIMGFDMSTPTSWGTTAYKNAINTIANPDEIDINMLVLPGVINKYAGSVITYANSVCEDRGDVFFPFDTATLEASPLEAIDTISGVDSSYSATYYPWVKIYDNENGRYLWVPPTVVMAGVIAFNDRVAAEWYAPAGFNRGGITDAVAAYTRLTQDERDTLYENRINPIATFVGQGIAAWGQKTLQTKASALDRINVRRLLIALKKYIASTTKYLVFEMNTVQTRTRFLNIVNPYLESVQQKQGLYAFKVVMDETNNTPDVIDRNMMKGAIFLQPTKVSEIISIDFNVLPTGATFAQ